MKMNVYLLSESEMRNRGLIHWMLPLLRGLTSPIIYVSLDFPLGLISQKEVGKSHL